MINSSKFLFILMAAFTLSCSDSNQNDVSTDVVSISGTPENPEGDGNQAQISFENEEHDFGHMVQGEIKKYSFKFKNTGNKDLIISNASASCGCTVPEVPKQPIPPGGSERIVVEFNSEGKSGTFEKTVTIVSNSNPQTKVLKIKGNIEVPSTK